MKNSTQDEQDNFESRPYVSVPLNSFSQQVFPSSKRLAFKVVCEGDCKRITMDIPIAYSEIISKCIKNFGLPQSPKYVLVSADENEKTYIDSQETLSHYLIRWQQKRSSAIKLNLVREERSERLTGQSDVTVEESGQQFMIQQPKNVIQPSMLLQIIQRLKEKGQVTIHDVKTMQPKNSESSGEQSKQEEESSVLQQCLAILSEIMQTNVQASDKSDEELGQSSQCQQLFSSKGSDVYRSAFADHRRSVVRDSLPSLKEYMKLSKQQIASDNSQRNSFTGDSKQFATFTGRSRTNSCIFETPGGDSNHSLPIESQGQNQCEQKLFSQKEAPQEQQRFNSGNSKKEKNKGFKGFLSSIFNKKNDQVDDDISLISDVNNTILERTESQEISLALSESQINQSYMK